MPTSTLSLNVFNDPALNGDDLLARMAWLCEIVRPRLDRFMGYYRNPTTELAAALPCGVSTQFAVRPFRQYQELGLPARITGFRRAADGQCAATGAIDVQRKEVVIENDIGWRINTLVDFTAGQMPAIHSTAADPAVRKRLNTVIHSLFDGCGGLSFLQHLVLRGAISGSAWIHFRPTAELLRLLATRAAAAMTREMGKRATAAPGGSFGGEPQAGGGAETESRGQDIASAGCGVSSDLPKIEVKRWLTLEIVDASRLCPLPHAGGGGNGERCEAMPAYAALLREQPREQAGLTNGVRWIDRFRAWFGRPLALTVNPQEFSFDLFGPTHWQRYERGALLEEGPNLLEVVPFVRYVNQVDPAAGTPVGPVGSGAIDTGSSDVEPLIGLQDELNTRLSDRAYRVTMTSFQMYLGKGIEDFNKRPVGPGQMWSTDNADASIESFGGDAATPSESAHISEVRQALDKISGVPQVAAGVFRVKLGNLSSGVALRLTLIALLARVDRKHAALEESLCELVRVVLGILDHAGIVPSAPEDRGIEINWPTAIPESAMDRLQEAQAKTALGVPREVVLGELGYGDAPAASTEAMTTV